MRQKRRIIWLKSAVDDLSELRNKKLKKRAVAPYLARTIHHMAEQLLKSPRLGQPIEDIPNFFDYTIKFGNHRCTLHYRVEREVIYIIQVIYKEYEELDLI